MKLALHRSITFWAGILVMAFIGWAWWDSKHFAATAWRMPQAATHGWGGLCVSKAGGLFDYGVPSGIERFPIEMGPRIADETFPKPQFIRAEKVLISEWLELSYRIGPADAAPFTMEERIKLYVGQAPVGSWTVFVPYWLVLLLFALGWSGLLGWRARRRKRAFEKNPGLARS